MSNLKTVLQLTELEVRATPGGDPLPSSYSPNFPVNHQFTKFPPEITNFVILPKPGGKILISGSVKADWPVDGKQVTVTLPDGTIYKIPVVHNSPQDAFRGTFQLEVNYSSSGGIAQATYTDFERLTGEGYAVVP
ncbi:MAG: hypothetical protein N2112_14755 [Gemmataceae bacterium]|jgi:hypothetical protein|nr:hypothetical protein [Gemmataceae bacterium]